MPARTGSTGDGDRHEWSQRPRGSAPIQASWWIVFCRRRSIPSRDTDRALVSCGSPASTERTVWKPHVAAPGPLGCRAKSVRSILQKGLDRIEEEQEESKQTPVKHSNIRGQEAYARGGRFMLINGLIERLTAMKLHGMVAAVEDIQNRDNSAGLSLEDCLTLMIDHEEAVRANRTLKRRLQVAKLHYRRPPWKTWTSATSEDSSAPHFWPWLAVSGSIPDTTCSSPAKQGSGKPGSPAPWAGGRAEVSVPLPSAYRSSSR